MKRFSLYVVSAIALLIFASGCDGFLLPEFPRNNPYDDQSPVAAVESFSVRALNTDSAQLTWTLPVLEDETRVPKYLLIVRNGNAVPSSVNDGTILNSGSLIDASTGTFTDSGNEGESLDISINNLYNYGVWSVYSEDEDFADTFSSEELDNYTLVGPKYKSLELQLSETTIYPSEDGYVEDTPARNFSGMTLSISGNAIYFNSLIRFDVANFPLGIENAELSIHCTTWTNDDILYVDPILESWDSGTIDYITTTNGTFADIASSGCETVIDAMNQYFSVDITSIYSSWLSGDIENNGLLLSGNIYGIGSTDFSSSEGTETPFIQISYYQ